MRGFQRRVWWPKCTPASRSWRRVNSGIAMGAGPFSRPVVPPRGCVLRHRNPGPGGMRRHVPGRERRPACELPGGFGPSGGGGYGGSGRRTQGSGRVREREATCGVEGRAPSAVEDRASSASKVERHRLSKVERHRLSKAEGHRRGRCSAQDRMFSQRKRKRGKAHEAIVPIPGCCHAPRQQKSFLVILYATSFSFVRQIEALRRHGPC